MFSSRAPDLLPVFFFQRRGEIGHRGPCSLALVRACVPPVVCIEFLNMGIYESIAWQTCSQSDVVVSVGVRTEPSIYVDLYVYMYKTK